MELPGVGLALEKTSFTAWDPKESPVSGRASSFLHFELQSFGAVLLNQSPESAQTSVRTGVPWMDRLARLEVPWKCGGWRLLTAEVCLAWLELGIVPSRAPSVAPCPGKHFQLPEPAVCPFNSGHRCVLHLAVRIPPLCARLSGVGWYGLYQTRRASS